MEWFRHDLDAHDDLKVRKLLRQKGFAALGAFWYLIEILYAQGGSLSEEDVTEELEIAGEPELKAALKDSGLFYFDTFGNWRSARVDHELEESNARVERFRRMGRTSAERRLNTSSTQVEPTLDASSTHNRTNKQNKDNTISDNLSIKRNINNTSSSAESSENASTSDEVPAAEEPAFITLPSNKGEEVPISEKMVQVWKDAYPAVDVKAELRKMKSWCISNPKLRKTAQGMKRFCDNWLSKAQDRVGRVPQQETIRGTNIQMSLVADGTRGRLEPEVKFD